MRSLFIVVAAGVIIGSQIMALDNTLSPSAIPYSGDALRTAIADGMSRAGASVARVDTGPSERRH